MTLERKPDPHDFVVVVRIKTALYGIPIVDTNRDAYAKAQELAEQVKRHCDGVSDAIVSIELDPLPQAGDWNRKEWED